LKTAIETVFWFMIIDRPKIIMVPNQWGLITIIIVIEHSELKRNSIPPLKSSGKLKIIMNSESMVQDMLMPISSNYMWNQK